MRFLVSTLFTGGVLALFLRWARSQSEQQIDKMQDAVFNSPGAEAPVPPRVLVAAFGLLIVLWFVDRRLFRLARWQTLSSLLTGGVGGIFALMRTRTV